MATDDSLAGKVTTIWFGAVDAVGADLAADAVEFQSFFTNFNETGGENDTESISVFGGGNITKTKPQTQKELTFDVVMRYNSKLIDFKKIERGDVITGVGATDSKVGMIAIQNTDGTNAQRIRFDSCSLQRYFFKENERLWNRLASFTP